MGQLVKKYTPTDGNQPAQADVVYSYNPVGAVDTLRYGEQTGGGFTVELPYQYNVREWLTEIGNVGSAALPFNARYIYFANGNIQESEYRNTGSLMEQHYKYAYGYDNANRLLSADYQYYSGSWQNPARFDVSGLQYDGNGNILGLVRKKEDNSTIDNLTYSYIAGTNRLQSVTDAVTTTPEDWDAESSTFAYDGNGNVVEMLENGVPALSAITYDHRNLPVSLINRNGDAVTYRYNAAGQRIYKQVGSQTPEYYIVDGDQTVAVYQNGAVKYWNILANGVVGRYEPGSGSKFYYLKDHLGSTRAVVNSSGTVVEAHDYYPFGLLMPGRDYQSGSETKEKFTGKELDSEAGWIHFPARPYHPGIGRWFSVDVIEEFPSPYVYVGNDPIRFYDLYGLSSSDTVYVVPEPLPPVIVIGERPWWAGIFDAYHASIGGLSWWFFGTSDYERVLYDAEYFGNVALPNFLAGLVPFGGGKLKAAGRGIRKFFLKRFLVRKLTGETHHLLSKKILRALSRHPTLAGIYSRNDPRFIYKAANKKAHRGYQKWHREVDDMVVKWIEKNQDATPAEFERFLHEIYQRPDIARRIPGVNLIE